MEGDDRGQRDRDVLREVLGMMQRWLAVSAGLLLAGLGCLAQAQSPIAGFPPGTFQSRAALDAVIGGSTVTLNVVGGSKYQGSSNSFNSTGANGIAVTPGTNTALLCTLIRRDNTNDVSAGVALTWDSGVSNQAMTYVASASIAGGLQIAQVWGLRAPVAGTTLHVAGTNTAADNFVACVALDHVLQTNDGVAFPHNTLSTPGTQAAVTTAVGNAVVGATSNQPNGDTMLGSTIFNDQISGSLINGGGDYIIAGSASETVGSSTSAGGTTSTAGVDVAHD